RRNAPADLSLADASPPSAALAYAGTPQGGAALVWVDLDDTVRATLRTSATGAFLPAQTVIAGDGCTIAGTGAPRRSPAATAINAAGDAVVLYQQTDATGAQVSVYAATTN